MVKKKKKKEVKETYTRKESLERFVAFKEDVIMIKE
jgi:hypothetical protein